jgi:hypothetical protein
MIKVVWEIEPAITALNALLQRLRNLRPAWKTVLAYLRRQALEQFASQGARSGSPWKPLNETYARWKAIRYPGQPILRASDQMFRSLVGKTGYSIEEATPDSLTYGTGDPKARYHQQGTPRMAKRKILEVTEADRATIKKIVRLHLENQSTLSGFERA